MSYTITENPVSRSFTITQSGVSRTFTARSGVGPKGDDGPAGPNTVATASDIGTADLPALNTPLSDALDGKAESSHTHPIAQITGIDVSTTGDPNIPAEVTVTGITDPSGSDPLTLARGADQNGAGYFTDGTWMLVYDGGASWTLTDGDAFLATLITSSDVPTGATGWNVLLGTAPFLLVSGDPTQGNFIGQLYTDGTNWWQWDGTEWLLLSATHDHPITTATTTDLNGVLTGDGANVSAVSTPLPLASGGTGADTAAAARTNLELGTGDDVVFNSVTSASTFSSSAGSSIFSVNGVEVFQFRSTYQSGVQNALRFGPNVTQSANPQIRYVDDETLKACYGNFGGTGFANWECANLTASGTVQTGTYTVATLPTPATGMRAMVSDSSVAASGNFGATVAGGGANVVPVTYDGTNWIIA